MNTPNPRPAESEPRYVVVGPFYLYGSGGPTWSVEKTIHAGRFASEREAEARAAALNGEGETK